MAGAMLSLVTIACAHNISESIRLQLMLDRAQLPYQMVGDKLYGLYGDAAMPWAGPIRFLIPANLKEQAESCLEELFEVQPCARAGLCPACEGDVAAGAVECPSCGLFLG